MTAATPVPPQSVGPTATWRYRPELDGLRTFAVVVIVFFHARVEGAASSFIVLDLFFVLSGFLVTNVVLSEVDRTGELRLGRYYARRVRRLLPAAVATILVTSVVFVMFASKPERLELVRQAQAALVYLANWQFIADGADYFAGDIRSSPFMHFWSLSIEEQYYIAFPLLLLVWWKLAPRRGRVLLVGLGGLAALSVLSQLYWAQVDPTRAYFATDARLFQLLAGAAMAVALREFATPSPEGGVRWGRAGRLLAVGGLAGYVLFGSELIGMTVSNRNLLATVLAGALVVGTYTAPGSLVSRFFALPWLVYLGKISYGIYLWHYPVLLVLARILDERPVVLAIGALGLAVSLAAASHQLLETPIRRARRLDPFPWPVVATGLSLSLVSAIALVGPILSTERRPTVVAPAASQEAVPEEVGSWEDRKVPGDLDFERIAADRGPGFRTCQDEPRSCQVVDGDGPHVVLVGDSHARMLGDAFAELAKEHDFRLSMDALGTCPWMYGLYNRDARPAARERCRESRVDFYDEVLPRMEPDLVVLVDRARAEEWGDDVRTTAGRSDASLRKLQSRAARRTVDKIQDAGARTVMVSSILGTGGWDYEGGFDPLDCLARAKRLGECAVSPSLKTPFVDALYERESVRNDDVATVDVNPIVCPDAPRCRPVLGGRVVWRDEEHVTAGVLRDRRDQVWDQVVDTGLVPDGGRRR